MRFSICDWKSRFAVAACGFAIFIAPSALLAQSKWTLTTSDFKTRQIEVAEITDQGVKTSDAGTVSLNDLLLLDRENPAKPQAAGGAFTLVLTTGDQLRGAPVKLEGETLQWNSSAIGPMQFPLKQVTAIVRGTVPAGDAKRTEDVVRLANGDQVTGIVSGLADGTIKVQSNGSEVPVPLDSVSAVLLASAGGATTNAATAQRSFRIRLADDSIITAAAIRLGEEKLTMTLASGGTREVPASAVAGVEQMNGPVSWLSSRTPSESVHQPLLDTPRPAKMDRTVAGKPIRFGDRTYTRGIGVAPHSRLSWAIDRLGEKGEGYRSFRTQYAIDGNGQYADVVVRILLDGKVVHERKDFTAGEISPVVSVPIDNAKSLTLEVDFGVNYGVQGQFNWIEPALVNAPASTAPRAEERAEARWKLGA